MAALIPPTVDLKALRHALKSAAVDKFGPDEAKWPKKMRRPEDVIKKCADSDHYQADEFTGWHYVNCSTKEPPGIVDAALKPITERREVYPGRWANISVNAYGYDTSGNKGVTLGLNNVQLLKHAAPLGGATPRPQDDFEAVAVEDDAEDGWDQ